MSALMKPLVTTCGSRRARQAERRSSVPLDSAGARTAERAAGAIAASSSAAPARPSSGEPSASMQALRASGRPARSSGSQTAGGRHARRAFPTPALRCSRSLPLQRLLPLLLDSADASVPGLRSWRCSCLRVGTPRCIPTGASRFSLAPACTITTSHTRRSSPSRFLALHSRHGRALRRARRERGPPHFARTSPCTRRLSSPRAPRRRRQTSASCALVTACAPDPQGRPAAEAAWVVATRRRLQEWAPPCLLADAMPRPSDRVGAKANARELARLP